MGPLQGALSKFNERGYAIVPFYASGEGRKLECLVRGMLGDRSPMRRLAYDCQSQACSEQAQVLIRIFDGGVSPYLPRDMPGETLGIEQIVLRAISGARVRPTKPHIDRGAYLVFVYAFGCAGTLMYPTDASGRVTVVSVPEHCGVLLSGRLREAALGIPSIVHASPIVPVSARRVIVAVAYGPGRSIRVSRSVRLAASLRVRRVRASISS